MRRRVLEALEGAAGDAQPGSDNERLTRELARAALERDRALGWQLAQNAVAAAHPDDRRAVRLARAADAGALRASARRRPSSRTPASSTGRPPNARCAWSTAHEEIAAAVRRLLRHLDGDWAIARGLLEGMLQRRDQWLRRVAGFTADGAARAALEQSFRAERARLARMARALMPDAEGPEIARLARYAAANGAPGETGAAIARLAELKGYPAPDASGIEEWRALATFLLVAGKPRMRKAANKLVGFPAGDGVARAFKDQMRGLLARLAAIDGLDEALHCPARHAAGRLHRRAMGNAGGDGAHPAARSGRAAARSSPSAARSISRASRRRAVRALGEEDAPTDLLLALDVRLQHLLVDEFQDTSRAQWELLTRLTAGWERGRRPHGLPGGRSDAVDLPVPRGGRGALPARARDRVAVGRARRTCGSRPTSARSRAW